MKKYKIINQFIDIKITKKLCTKRILLNVEINRFTNKINECNQNCVQL